MSARRYRIPRDVPDAATHFLRSALEDHGWRRTDDDWRFNWSFITHQRSEYAGLRPEQRVNHFPGIGALHFKDELHHFLVQARRRMRSKGLKGWYDFFPPTFAMPWDFEALRETAAASPDTVWIAKPKRLALGEGVHLVEDLDQVDRGEKWLVQEYIADPLLLPGLPFKPELRVYVLVTSLVPLVVYWYHNGLVRFTSRPYTTAPEARSDRLVHLTSVGVQRTNHEAAEPVVVDDFLGYSARLRAAGFDDVALFASVRSLVIQTLLAHREPVFNLSTMFTAQMGSCFELLGFDVLLDSSGKCWLAEVNRAPDIEASEPGTAHYEVRRRVKEPMVRDMTTLIGAGEPSFDDGIDRFDREISRRGGWERIFPAADAQEYAIALEAIRPQDRAMIEASVN